MIKALIVQRLQARKSSGGHTGGVESAFSKRKSTTTLGKKKLGHICYLLMVTFNKEKTALKGQVRFQILKAELSS